jgi:hypothetical protein
VLVYSFQECCALHPYLSTLNQSPVHKPKKGKMEFRNPLRTTSASRIDRAPKLDGTLDDPAWQQATIIAKFLQREPFEGQTPTEKTEVRILYDKPEVYFGITCFPDGHGEH